MSKWPSHPVVYELNAWTWLSEASQDAGEQITLGSVPQHELERLAGFGFDGIWLMGVWHRSPASRRIAREHADLRVEFERALPGFAAEDVVGSPYAVYRYSVDPALGDDQELASLRERLAQLGLRLVLDFVPNHLAVDHAWVQEHPERLLRGCEADVNREPENYFRTGSGELSCVLAHGRDPYFAGWTDTVQLDYRRPETRRAMRDVLSAVAAQCDGVRCDMAMLVLRSVFRQTWGGDFEPETAEFWHEAIPWIRARHPEFVFLAEAYWDLEWELQQLGFDYVYDKRLYDRVLAGSAEAVQLHLGASLDFQRRLARFIENHDERRAIDAYGPTRSRAAATLVLSLPGLRLLHDGQLEGRRTKLPVQLRQRQPEPRDATTQRFYRKLLAALRQPVFHEGEWRLLAPVEAWPGNASHRRCIAHLWTLGEECRLVVVNLSEDWSQCYVPLAELELGGDQWLLVDLLGDSEYLRTADDLRTRGLYVDLAGHGHHLFAFRSGQAA